MKNKLVKIFQSNYNKTHKTFYKLVTLFKLGRKKVR
jgi:hypothetical protein